MITGHAFSCTPISPTDNNGTQGTSCLRDYQCQQASKRDWYRCILSLHPEQQTCTKSLQDLGELIHLFRDRFASWRMRQ